MLLGPLVQYMMGSQCRRYTLVSSTSVASFCENVKLSRKKVVLVVFEKQVLFSFFNYLHTQVDEFTFENLYSWACDIVITYERYAASMDRFLHELQHTKMRGEKMWDDGTRRTIRPDIDVRPTAAIFGVPEKPVARLSALVPISERPEV